MKILQSIAARDISVFALFSLVICCAIILNGICNTFLFFGVPAACLFAYWLIHDLKLMFMSVFAILPFTVEVELPGGLGLDLPTEMLMILFTGVGFLLLVMNSRDTKAGFILHPVSILLILHLSWIVFSSLLSTVPVISLKYVLAKSWYIIPFYCLSYYFLRTKADYLKTIRVLLIAVFIACCYVWFNHVQVDFSFKDVNPSVYPIFRNHVNYACLILVTLPFLAFYTNQYKGKFKALLFALGLFFVVAIFFSYTRAAMISLVIGMLSYVLIKWRLIQYAILISGVSSLLIVGSLIKDNEFVLYAPDYNRTITHQKFDDLIDATAKGEDISTMERAYRWIAGYYMIQDKPIVGFGPGTFYSNYKSYTIRLFKTYVSDNPEGSTIHNYYLLVLVEQGLIGFILFMSLIIYALVRGQYIYHKSTGYHKSLIMAALVCLIMILSINLINDMIESLKVGAFFFLCLAIIVGQDIQYSRSRLE